MALADDLLDLVVAGGEGGADESAVAVVADDLLERAVPMSVDEQQIATRALGNRAASAKASLNACGHRRRRRSARGGARYPELGAHRWPGVARRCARAAT